MNAFTKTTVGLATAGLLIAGLAACSTDTASTSTSSSSSSAAATVDASPAPVASFSALTGVDTQVTLDAGFLDALTTLGLTPGVLGGATLDGAVLSFPITAGYVNYYDPTSSYRPFVQGSISHTGSGISLTAGGTVVELSDFRIDPGVSKLFATVKANGTLVANDVYLFNLDGSTLNPAATDDDGNTVLEGTTVLMSPDAAALLNTTFGTDAVTDQLVVGIAKITVNGD